MASLTRPVVILASLLLWIRFAQAANLSAEDAAKHVGETTTVCGNVASANYASRSRGHPTFLDIDKAYPSSVFTVVIWGENRSQFGSPETELMGKRICATGVIELYRNRPEIIVSSPSQLHQE